MGFTKLSAGGGSLVMDAAFFAQAIPLTHGLDDGVTGVRTYVVEIDDGYGSNVSVGPYPSQYPVPFEPGVATVPGVGTVVVRASLNPYSTVGPDGISYYWQVNYFTLEPGAAAKVESLQLFPLGTGDYAVQFTYLLDQTSGTLHLNDFAPIAATVGTVYDREAANLVSGGESADLILGFGGNDTLTGNGGADTIDGGNGNDLISAYWEFSLPVVYGIGGPGGDGAVDSLVGGAGNDTLVGDGDADRISGGTGNDLLMGFYGADVLNGGTGNDTLVGGAGVDVLTGGAGRDWFFFDTFSTFGSDKIKDFTPGQDKIVIQVSSFDGSYTAGMDLGATGHFAANLTGRANSPAGVSQFVYDTDNGKLFWDEDGAGGAKGVLLATLSGLPALTAADVLVIA